MNFRKKPDPHGHCEFDAETGTVKNCLVGLESANKFACDPRVPEYAKLKNLNVDEVVELLRKVSNARHRSSNVFFSWKFNDRKLLASKI